MMSIAMGSLGFLTPLEFEHYKIYLNEVCDIRAEGSGLMWEVAGMHMRVCISPQLLDVDYHCWRL